MALETESQYFRGVVCLHCKAPIPVPAIVGRTTAASDDGQEAWRENSTVFNLRCPTCRKEKPYRTREIVDFEGTPEARIPQFQPTSPRSFQSGEISKAAKA
jgi:hypothetical protein